MTMADWRSRGKGDDSDMDDDDMHERRQRGRRGHGRGTRGFGSRQEYGGSDEFAFPGEFMPPPEFGQEVSSRDRNFGNERRSHERDLGQPRDSHRSGGRAERSEDDGDAFRSRAPAPTGERVPRDFQASSERGPRQLGTVKFFKSDKGFGFITPDDGTLDVFVHISAVERSGLAGLESGQRLSFATEPDRRGKGPKAVELQLESEGD